MAVKAKITATNLKNLSIEEQRINDTEISGFHARISPKGLITYYLFYRINGKQVNYRLGIDGQITSAQARDLAKDKSALVHQGVDVQAEKKKARIKTSLSKFTTLSAFLEQKYFPFLKNRNPKTADKVMKALRSSFPKLNEKQLEEITAWELEKWRSERLDSGVKPATVNRQINALQGCLSRAVEWGVIESHDLKTLKALKVDNSKVRYLSKDEEQRLREALKQRDEKLKQARTEENDFRKRRRLSLKPDLSEFNYPDHVTPVVLLAMNTGMRRGEMLSLEWHHINLERKVLTIVYDKTKSGQTRHIPLNNEAYNALVDWQKLSGETGYVFKDNKGSHIIDINSQWNALLKHAEITDFRFHDLRHHFASKLVMATVDLNTVRELLGHSDLTMTLRYAHLAPEHKAAAVNLIG
ncbi:MAG: tyrosine-type recombinase/integrase [Thalassotalea sp.]